MILPNFEKRKKKGPDPEKRREVQKEVRPCFELRITREEMAKFIHEKTPNDKNRSRRKGRVSDQLRGTGKYDA